ncbi:hypothetical protein [Paraburkholderia sediminicola]|uniref:hypothetical protein n=1 Tax=Paraburkholderia sediminicola TaxID=458836 RepID=UPI0038B979D5
MERLTQRMIVVCASYNSRSPNNFLESSGANFIMASETGPKTPQNSFEEWPDPKLCNGRMVSHSDDAALAGRSVERARVSNRRGFESYDDSKGKIRCRVRGRSDIPRV